MEELKEVLKLCLPKHPYNLTTAIDRYSQVNTKPEELQDPESLLLQSARLFIDEQLKNETVRRRVIVYFVNKPVDNWNCEFLQTRLDLFLDVYKEKVNDPNDCGKPELVDLTLFKNHFVLYFRDGLVMKAVSQEEFSTELPLEIIRDAFLCKVRWINITIEAREEGISEEEVKLKMETFLDKLNWTRLDESSYVQIGAPESALYCQIRFCGCLV